MKVMNGSRTMTHEPRKPSTTQTTARASRAKSHLKYSTVGFLFRTERA
jgi:hypothetical protein